MFALAEFAIESILREGLNDLKTDDTDLRLTDIFGRLRLPDISAKYGNTQIEKIKTILLRGEINIVQALSQLDNTKLPAYSIHLLGDTEDEAKAAFGDTDGSESTPISPSEIVPAFTATSYDSVTGKVVVPDSVDLSGIYANQFYEDGLGQTFKIENPVDSVLGDKHFTLATGIVVITLAGGRIISSISEKIHDVRFIPAAENIMIGVHSENALLTKFLYYILRYILYRKKEKFQEYNLVLSKYNGSDFSLKEPLLPENVYSRFITAQFITYNFWRNDELQIIDTIQPSVGGVGQFQTIVCFTPDAYDVDTGFLSAPDSADLSAVVTGYVFFDAIGSAFIIEGSVSDTAGSKGFKIKAGQTIDISGEGCVKKRFNLRVEAESDREDENLMTWETDVKS